MITKVFGNVTVAEGSTESLEVYTKYGNFAIPGKKVVTRCIPDDEYDADFGKALVKKKFNLEKTDNRISQHLEMADLLEEEENATRRMRWNLEHEYERNKKALLKKEAYYEMMKNNERNIAFEMSSKMENMQYERDYFIESHFNNN